MTTDRVSIDRAKLERLLRAAKDLAPEPKWPDPWRNYEHPEHLELRDAVYHVEQELR